MRKLCQTLANFFAGQELANSKEQFCSPSRYLLKTKTTTTILRLLRSEHLVSWDVLEKNKVLYNIKLKAFNFLRYIGKGMGWIYSSRILILWFYAEWSKLILCC